jgi:uncharacterized membrane protein (UPF0127 family)
VRWLSIAAILVALAVAVACGGSSSNSDRAIGPMPDTTAQTVPISFAGGTLQVEIADTAAERAVGLMSRSSLGYEDGMLFAFPSDTSAAFWMTDTLVPLSIAFVRADGTIVHIEDMQPETTTNHYSTEPYRYAIEANQGWFATHNVAEGDKAQIPAAISATS